MKQIALGLTTFIVTTFAFAAFPGAIDPTEVSIPSLPGGMIIGGSIFYLEPGYNNGDLIYATDLVTEIKANPTVLNKTLSVEPGYSGAWNIFSSYIFPDTANDISFSYFNLHTNDTASFSETPVAGFIKNINPFNVLPDFSFLNATAEANYSLDQVDATFGQYINIGCRTLFHTYAGARWLDLQRTLNSTFARVTAPTYLTIDERSQYEGLGPISGFDTSYYLGRGLGLVAHADAALLVGSIQPQLNSLNISAPETETYAADTSSRYRVVPVLDAKLGANYTYLFHNDSNSGLTLELGYQASHYWNAIDRIYASTTGAFRATGRQSHGFGLFEGTVLTKRKTSSLSLEGPYASLAWHI